MSRTVVTLASTAILVALGIASFFAGRYLLSEDGGASAQQGEKTEKMQMAEADSQKARFVGQLNGMTFYEVGNYELTEVAACRAEPPRELLGSNARDAAASSDLDFEPGEMPEGMSLMTDSTVVCGNVVASISRSYTSAGGPQISIARDIGAPEFVAEAPRDRLQESTIGGRKAVVMTPMFEGHSVKVYMSDETSTWLVSGFNVDADTVVKVAENLKSVGQE